MLHPSTSVACTPHLAQMSYPVGIFVRTEGCREPGDGGGGVFAITDRAPDHYAPDGLAVVHLENGNCACLTPVRGVYDLLSFGPDGRDLHEALNRAMDYAEAGSIIQYPTGDWRNSKPWFYRKRLVHQGVSGGTRSQPATTIHVPKNQSAGTVTYGRDNAFCQGYHAQGMTLRHLHFRVEKGESPNVPGPGAEPGLRIFSNCIIEGVKIEGASGHGIEMIADVRRAGMRGNANGWRFSDLYVLNSGKWGMYLDGGDANAGTLIAGDFIGNSDGGLWDSSFLGNTYFGLHLNANAVRTQVSHQGYRYGSYLENRGIEPGVTPGWERYWYRQGEGGVHYRVYPRWDAERTYGAGGALRFDNPNARSVAVGCYVEGNQIITEVVSPSIMIGGAAEITHGNGSNLSPNARGQVTVPTQYELGGAEYTTNTHGDALWRFRSTDGGNPVGWQFGRKEGGAFTYRNFEWWFAGRAGNGLSFLDDLNTYRFGRGEAPGGGGVWAAKFYLGAADQGAREIGYTKDDLTGQPAEGAADGEIRYPSQPVLGGPSHYVAVGGVWRVAGRIEQGGNLAPTTNRP